MLSLKTLGSENFRSTYELPSGKPINILEKTKSSIIYELPPGKPNTRKKSTLDDSRERVIQSANKGRDSWYNNFNFIRDRIGKEYLPEDADKRCFEKLASMRRKKLIKIESSLPLGDLNFVTLKEAEALLSSPYVALCNTGIGSENFDSLLKNFVEDRSFNNLKEFIDNKWKQIIEINISFLNCFEKGFETNRPVIEKFNLLQKVLFTDILVREISAEMYDLKKSAWTPSSGIDGLINELNRNGPLCIGGRFGKQTYVDDCFKLGKQIGGREIFSWKKDAIRKSTGFTHAVLIVGAKKINDNGYVYFIDPNDESDPQDRSKQKIYLISFKNLILNIDDIDDISKDFTQDSHEYAYYGNFAIKV